MWYDSDAGFRTGFPDTPLEAHADMKWFRSNARLGSRLALFALAIQLVLSFGHFHGNAAPASSAAEVTASKFNDGGHRLGEHSGPWDWAVHAIAASAARLKAISGSGHEPAGQPADDCATCAVMAMAANAMIAAAPPCLSAPRPVAWLYYSTSDANFPDPGPALDAYQPRAPPIA